jgi:ribosomal protein L14
VQFNDNVVVVINQEGNPKGTYVFGHPLDAHMTNLWMNVD